MVSRAQFHEIYAIKILFICALATSNVPFEVPSDGSDLETFVTVSDRLSAVFTGPPLTTSITSVPRLGHQNCLLMFTAQIFSPWDTGL